MQDFVVLVLNAMTLASALALVAMGLAIVFGLMRVINLAHADFMAIGAYISVSCDAMPGGFWISLALAPFLGLSLGYAIERILLRTIKYDATATILATWGLGLVIQQTLQLIFGATPRAVTVPVKGTVLIGQFGYPSYRIFLIAMSTVLVSATFVILYRTAIGLQLRAALQNSEAASAMGIDTEAVASRSFAVGTAVATVAGVLVSPITVVVAQLGNKYLAQAFLVVILGGVGAPNGILYGSGFMGIVETSLAVRLPPTFAQALTLLLAITVTRLRYRSRMSEALN